MDQSQVRMVSRPMNGTAISQVLLLLLLAFRIGESPGQENRAHQLQSSPVYVNQQGVITYAIDIDTLTQDTLQFDFTYWEGWRDSKFYAGRDTVFITRNSRESEYIHCRGTRKTVVFDVVSQMHPFGYEEAYRREKKDQVSVEIPVVHELAGVVVALTEKAQKTPAWYAKNKQYLGRVNRYFSAYKSHPLITYLNKHGNADLFLNFRENAAAYEYGGKHIRLGRTYRGFRARDQFKALLPLVEDFAARSNFIAFYQGETGFYNTLIKIEAEKADIKSMWKWLEKHFSSKYQSYKVIMSPLNPGSHSARQYEEPGFKEGIMFISAPGADHGEPDEGGIRRTVFTEIDHNYVNPVSEKYSSQIEEALSNHLEKWNVKKSYYSPLLTFNEYMTWAVFGLYVYDTYGKEVYATIMPEQIFFIESRKGFVKFKDFNNKLLELYLARRRENIAALYPQMIEWIENENKGS
jgi:hypothetical protein